MVWKGGGVVDRDCLENSSPMRTGGSNPSPSAKSRYISVISRGADARGSIVELVRSARERERSPHIPSLCYLDLRLASSRVR